jgi:hypothetical protein
MMYRAGSIGNFKPTCFHLHLLNLSDNILPIQGAYFNADTASGAQEASKTCINHGLKPNIPENKRNQKQTKRDRKRMFKANIYKQRFVSERSFAWIEKFQALLIRFVGQRDLYFLNEHYIAFTMINIRHWAQKKLNQFIT